MTIGIYQITNNLNKKQYIGQSIDIENRILSHFRTKDNCYIHQAIQKYGKENFSYKIIEICSKDELDEREKYYIKKYNTLRPNGYNLTEGGHSVANFVKRPISKYTIGGKLIESYSSIKEAARQNNLDSRNIQQALDKKVNTCGGFQWYDIDDINIIRNPKTNTGYDKIPVCQYDLLTGQFLREFDSCSEAARFCGGKDTKQIKKCCEYLNYGYQGYGYLWSYLSDKRQFLTPYDSKKMHQTNNKPVKQIDIVTNQILKVYENVKIAAEELGMKKGGNSAILRVCNGKQQTCCGYRWEYV